MIVYLFNYIKVPKTFPIAMKSEIILTDLTLRTSQHFYFEKTVLNWPSSSVKQTVLPPCVSSRFVFTQQSNMYPRVKIQSAFLTKCIAEALDVVAGRFTKSAHCSSGSMVGMQRANSTAYRDTRVGRNGKVFDPTCTSSPRVIRGWTGFLFLPRLPLHWQPLELPSATPEVCSNFLYQPGS